MKLITQKELAEVLGVSPQVIYNWIKRGKLDTEIAYGRRVVNIDKDWIKLKIEQIKKRKNGK